MNIRIIDSRGNFRQILKEFSAGLYLGHPFLNLQCDEPIDRNFDKGFVLYSNDKIAATACVIKNPELMFRDKSAVCIAFYECIDDTATSRVLLQAVGDYCKQQGFRYLIGPMNGSTWNAYRFATEPITDSYLSEPFHKSYYAHQFQDSGFQTVATYYTQIDTTLYLPQPGFLNENISFRTLDKSHYELDIKNIFAFCTEIFRNNFLYTAISEAAFLEKYKALQSVINPEYVIIAEDHAEMVGLILALHDSCCQKEKRLIIKTIGRKSAVRYAGVAHELTRRVMSAALQHNYRSVLHAFMHQDNVSKNVSAKFSGKPFRTYKLFYKAL